jgi:hypothetical protein
MAPDENEYMCIGGPLDGERITLSKPATKVETALDVSATYMKTRLRRRVEDYTTHPPTFFFQQACVLMCEVPSLSDASDVASRLKPCDWREIPGTRKEMPDDTK